MSVKIGVFKGISKNQTTQLISLTKRDSEITKYTNDIKRFGDLTKYKKWSNGKEIYTLTDDQKNLLGIIWFSKKETPEVPKATYTFAIRIYPPIRGKGYAKKFMEESIKLFKSPINNQNDKKILWLSTMISNIKAINLYKSFGFTIVRENNGKLFMLLSK